MEKLTADLVVKPESFLETIAEETVFLGDGSHAYRSLIKRVLGKRALFVPSHLYHPRAAAVASLGLAKVEREDFLDVAGFSPLYVRPSDAELKRTITADAYKNRAFAE